MPTPLYLRAHATGQVIDPLWGNYSDRTLFLLEEFAIETSFVLRVLGTVPDYMNMIVDMFFDSSVYDSGATTAVVDTTAHITHLPGGFTTGVDYIYQTLEQTLDVAPSVAEFTIVRNDNAALTFTPKLSVVVSGSHTFVTGTLVLTRDTDITLYTIFDDFLNLGQTNTLTTTAVVDTVAGVVKLPGAAEDAFVTPTQVTNNSVADWSDDNPNQNTRIPGGDVVVNDATGDILIVYSSFEFSSTYRNIRFRLIQGSDGQFRTYSGNTYINVTTRNTGAAGFQIMAPRIDYFSDGTAAITYQDDQSQDIQCMFVELNPTTGTLSTPVLVNNGGSANFGSDLSVNRTLNRAYITHAGDLNSNLNFSIRYVNQGSATVTNVVTNVAATKNTPGHIVTHLDQQNNLHVAVSSGINTTGVSKDTLNYNVWNFAGPAWAYGAGVYNAAFTQTITAISASGPFFDMDVNEFASGSNREAYLVYIDTTNIRYRSIINGVAGTIRDVLLTGTQQELPMIWFNPTDSRKHILYCDAVAGMRYNTLSSSDVLGTEQTVDAAALDASGQVAWGFQKLVVAYRRGTNNAAASEVYVTSKPTGFTLLQKQWNSVKFPISLAAQKFLVVSDKTQTADHTIIYEITANATAGSPTYETVTLNVPGTFTVPGTQIALRIKLQTTNGNTTPTVNNIRAYPLVPAKEDTYEFTGLTGTKAKLQVLLKSSSGAVDAILYRLAAFFS